MARVSRTKPTSTGPGRGSPRTRTAARPGERAHSDRGRARPVGDDADAVIPAPTPASSKAFGVTWRLILLGVVIAAIAMTLAQSLRVYFAQASEIAELRSHIDEERERIAHLEDQLQRWEDPEFVKAEARERLGWVMPGEVGYRVIGIDGEPIGGDSAVLGADDAMSGPWYERLWGSVALADQPVEEETAEPQPSAPATVGPSTAPTTDEDE